MRAKHRGIAWILTDSEAMALLAQHCRYCGGDGGTIDRVDSKGPYAPDNVVPSCLRCNLMKNAMGLDVWLEHMRKIISHMDG